VTTPTDPALEAGEKKRKPRKMNNRYGDRVEVDAKGRCLDCGYQPDKCSPDDHR